MRYISPLTSKPNHERIVSESNGGAMARTDREEEYVSGLDPIIMSTA